MDTNKLRTFYILIVTQTLSLIGSRISSLAIGIWIYTETGNATPLTLVAFFTVLPMVMASSLSGVLADRWDRRYVMAISDAGQAIGTVLLLIAFTSDSFELWQLYIITAYQSIFGVLQGPAFQSAATMLVPEEQRNRANSIQQMSGPAAFIIAPALTGLLYASIGVSGAIIIDLLTFVVATLVVLNVSIPRPEETQVGRVEKGSVWYESLTGLRFLRNNPTFLALVLYVSMANFLVGGVMVLSVPYILARTQDEALLGLVQSVTSVGALTGAIIFAAWGGTRQRIHTIMPAMLIMGVMLTIAGTGRTALTLAIPLFFMVMTSPIINTSFITLTQAKVPPDIQGRVFAVLGQISLILTPIAYLINGPLADRVFEPAVGATGWERIAPVVGSGSGAGIGLMYFGAGLLLILLTLIFYANRSIRQMEHHMPDYKAAATPGETPILNNPETAPDVETEPAPVF